VRGEGAGRAADARCNHAPARQARAMWLALRRGVQHACFLSRALQQLLGRAKPRCGTMDRAGLSAPPARPRDALRLQSLQKSEGGTVASSRAAGLWARRHCA
jgi:hypothetical protein